MSALSAWIVIAVLEIALVVRTCKQKSDKKTWRRDRLIVRAAEVGNVALHLFCAGGQKWRFVPALGLLLVLLLIAALGMLLHRNREEGPRKVGGAVASCVLSLVFLALVLVPALLFTDYNGLPTSGPYTVRETSAILVDRNRTDPFETDGSSREVPVHLYYPETTAGSGERFPLVVFSHGAFGYYQSNTSTYMELASNGYVVAALDHPHHAFFTTDTDGRTVLVDMDFMNAALNLNTDMDPADQYALYTQWMALRSADMGFAVDAVKAAAAADALDDAWHPGDGSEDDILSVLRMIDVSRIGLMGHSMGGATAVELGRERDDIAAVVDIDGTMLSEYTGVENGQLAIRQEPYTVPVLEFNNWSSYTERKEYLSQGGVYSNEEVIGHASAGFTTAIRNTGHMDFTDLPLLSPFLGNMLGSGTRDTAETMTIVNALVLSFFNCYLKGAGVFTVQDIY